jgi:chondroitin-sulfate-ABC endolyase/exolyase
MNDAETRFAAYNIKRTKSGISGKHIFMETANAHVVAAPPGYADHGVAVRFLLQDMKRLAKRYQQTPAESRSTPQLLRAKEIFLLMTEHLLDQGFAEGSDLGTMHHPGYGLRGWIEAVTLMAEELKEAGLYDSSLRALFYYYPAGFSETEEGECWYLMDYLNGHAMQCLMLNLFGDDKVAAAKLYKYSRLLSSQLSAPSLGKLGGIKPDGALFHHGQLYIGYAAGILSASGLFKLLDGTVFELSREAYDKVKKAFLACYVWSEPWSGLAACGRHPVTSRMNRAALIASTAELAVAVPGTSGEDEELAATVMREQPGSDSMELFGVEIRPASKLQGFSAMNYAALGIHKYGDSSVAISGFGKGVSGGETYRNANRYRRYNNQGSIQVFKTTAEHSSGFSQVYGMPGWDWCLTPGTTAMRLPYNVLEGSVSFYGWQPPQDTGPSGAGSLEGRIGAFIFQSDFNTCRPLAQQMRMRKSVFANGSHLICLGSGITATNEIYPVVTTLFQGELPAEDAVMWMGTENGYINLTHSLEGEILLTNTTWIIDAYGTGYMLPRDSRLRMRRGRHVSRDGNTGEATEALMSAVWIKHGINPSGATYRYDIILDAEPQQMADMYRAQSLGITKVDILRRDDAVHAVVFPDRNIEAYVYFEACQNGETFLRSVDRCSIILLRKRVNGSVVMSVTNPLIADLAGTEPVETRLNVAGRWKVARYNPSVCCSPQANNTDLVISPTRGLPVEFVLQKIK